MNKNIIRLVQGVAVGLMATLLTGCMFPTFRVQIENNGDWPLTALYLIPYSTEDLELAESIETAQNILPRDAVGSTIPLESGQIVGARPAFRQGIYLVKVRFFVDGVFEEYTEQTPFDFGGLPDGALAIISLRHERESADAPSRVVIEAAYTE